ncbi:MAG TPA: ATP-binding protein [Actinomycetota bacterium]|jgi:signal transduction histidine kinase|nr:ATP-binding protein [Actinomycetota bacterium]
MLLGVAGVIVGVAAEQVAFRWSEPLRWGPDLLVGWAFIGAGLVGWGRRPRSGTGPIMVVTGLTWFLGNFASADVRPIAWLGTQTLYLHRGPLVHAVLSFPNGRLSSRLDRSAVTVGYIMAAAPPISRNGIATIALAGMLVAIAVGGYLATIGRARRDRAEVVRAAVAVGGALAGSSALRLALASEATSDVVLVVYDLWLAVVAVGLLAGLLRAGKEGAEVTDLVVELTESPAPSLRDELARALGDPTILIGYAIPGSATYVDALGRPIETPGPGRAVTPIELDGRRVGVLVHDPAVSGDPALLGSIASAAALAASNARLQAEVRAQLAEVTASRRRLVEVADEERRRLERRLREGTERRLDALATKLSEARAWLGAANGGAESLELADRQLRRTLEDLHELARGLYPATLREGLVEAVSELARRSPIPIEVDVTETGVPAEVKVAAYFVCSEAIANVEKYAGASSATIRIGARDDLMVVEVADDGIGGADLGKGSGLRGLVDRIEALGGRLRIDSRAGSGTRLTAEIPLGGKAS